MLKEFWEHYIWAFERKVFPNLFTLLPGPTTSHTFHHKEEMEIFILKNLNHQQMERYTMFLDWKKQYCEKDYTTQSTLQIQCNPYQITNGIFYGTRTNHLKISLETQKTPNSQRSLEGKKRSWRNQTPWLQTILQSYSNQDNMILAQKQKYRSMEQDRKPRGKPTHLWSTNLWQRRQRYKMEKRQSLQ